MSRAEIEEMSILERIQAMEMLWDSLCQDEEEIQPPSWHEEVLEERRIGLESGKARFISLSQLKDLFRE
jgi:hypothetical protein